MKTGFFRPLLALALGQQILVENTAGASGTIGTGKVARAKPDGCTLLPRGAVRAAEG